MRLRSRIVTAFALGVVGCGSYALPPSSSTDQLVRLQRLRAERTREDVSPGARINAGDELQLFVFGVDELSGEFTVAGDGTIDFPLVGAVSAAGETEEELAARIRERLLASHMNRADVRVVVKEHQGRRIAVLGAVRRPGHYSLHRDDETILTVLGRAGGLLPTAAGSIYFAPAGAGSDANELATASSVNAGTNPDMIRGSRAAMEVALAPLFEGHRVALMDLPVRAGDTILAPEGGEISVDGWVAEPGTFPLRAGITVTQAVTKAGGIHFGGSPRKVVLSRRGANGSREKYRLPYPSIASGEQRDVYLREGDRIAVGANPGTSSVWALYKFLETIVSVGIGGTLSVF